MSGRGSVLVTGGAKRIGKVICDVLRERGWNVLVHSREPYNLLCAELSQDFETIEAMFNRALNMAPDLCAVVNNASVFFPSEDVFYKNELRMQTVNTDAPAALLHLLYRHLEHIGGRGVVVNMLDSRIVSRKPQTPYEKTKHKLLEETLMYARKAAPVLRVNGVAPGPVLAPADKANSVPGGDVLLDARPTPRDVAEAVAYLLEAESVTGQILVVDSGQSLLAGGESSV